MNKQCSMDRILAYAYDVIFVGLIFFASLFLFEYLNKKIFKYDNILKWVILISFWFVIYFFFYGILPLILKGTIGHNLNDLKVEVTSGKMTFGRMLFREVIFKHLFYLTIIGIVVEIIFIIVKKNTLHDYYLKTNVVKKT